MSVKRLKDNNGNGNGNGVDEIPTLTGEQLSRALSLLQMLKGELKQADREAYAEELAIMLGCSLTPPWRAEGDVDVEADVEADGPEEWKVPDCEGHYINHEDCEDEVDNLGHTPLYFDSAMNYDMGYMP